MQREPFAASHQLSVFGRRIKGSSLRSYTLQWTAWRGVPNLELIGTVGGVFPFDANSIAEK
jgi:hypothetical protein